MSFLRACWVVWANIRRNRRSFLLASVGLVVGVATGTFFVALGAGIQTQVLDRIYPVNQIEIEPSSVAVMGIKEKVLDPGQLGEPTVKRLKGLPGVVKVYPKLRSKMQARLWGGKSLFGYDAKAEAFFDGLASRMVIDDLKEMEGIDRKQAFRSRRRPRACKADEECPIGQECDGARCEDVQHWKRYRYAGTITPCQSEAQCVEGARCVAGRCEPACEADTECGVGYTCVTGCAKPGCPNVCRRSCTGDAGCPTAFFCAGGGRCERFACTVGHPRNQFSERPADCRGRVTNRCAGGLSPTDPSCHAISCPRKTYCAPTSVTQATGFCEAPLPAALSPFLVEVFNTSAAEALGLREIDGTEALLGMQFRVHLGDSYLAGDLPRESQAVKRAEVVGFSTKALDFGFTLPIEYVRVINARYKGRAASTRYSTFILETRENADVSVLLGVLKQAGFTLGRKSKDAQKAADLLFILTMVFAFISVVIAAVAAVNIGNTFMMIVAERRYEIGIMRATGASRGDVRRLILLEATALGVFGGLVGEFVSFGASRLANWVAAEQFKLAVYKPEDFFVYDGWLCVGGVAIATVFCLVGAFFPAQRAAALDPAVVLTS